MAENSIFDKLSWEDKYPAEEVSAAITGDVDGLHPKLWNRDTVADGKYMQQDTMAKFFYRDMALASAVDELGGRSDNSWKQWSEDHGSSGDDESVWIGKNSSAYDGGFALGIETIASGFATYSEGTQNSAFGVGTHAEGNNNIVSGVFSHVEGSNNIVNSNYSFAHGNENSALAESTFVVGNNNIVTTNVSGSFIAGNSNSSFSGDLNSDLIHDPLIAINIGGGNTLSGEGVNLGKNNSAEDFGVGVGQNLYTRKGSYAFGQYASAEDGSFVFGGNSVSANHGAYVAGRDGVSADLGSVAVGTKTVLAKQGSVAFGQQSISADSGAVAVGMNTVSASNDAIVFGSNGVSATNNAITVGMNGVFATQDAMAVGKCGVTASPGGFAIGRNNVLSENGGFPVGMNGVTATYGSLAAGCNTVKAEDGSVAVGVVGVSADESVAVGRQGVYADEGAVAIGSDNISAFEGLAVGRQHVIADYGAVAIGTDNVSAAQGVSIGGNNVYTTYGGLAVGKDYISAAQSVSIGVNNINSQNGGIAIGHDYVSADGGGIAIGRCTSGVNGGHTFGYNAVAVDGSIAEGDFTSAGWGSVAIGQRANSIRGSVAIGWAENDRKYGSSYVSAFSDSYGKRALAGCQNFSEPLIVGYRDENNELKTFTVDSLVNGTVQLWVKNWQGYLFSTCRWYSPSYYNVTPMVFSLTFSSTNSQYNSSFEISARADGLFYTLNGVEQKVSASINNATQPIFNNAFYGFLKSDNTIAASTNDLTVTSYNVTGYTAYIDGKQKFVAARTSEDAARIAGDIDARNSWSYCESAIPASAVSAQYVDINDICGGIGNIYADSRSVALNVNAEAYGNSFAVGKYYGTDDGYNDYYYQRVQFKDENGSSTTHNYIPDIKVVLTRSTYNTIASGLSIAMGLGANNSGAQAYGGSIALGTKTFAAGQSLGIGVIDWGGQVNATGNSLAIGGSISASGLGFTYGQSLTAVGESIAIGRNNKALYRALTIGGDNTATNNGVILGYGNTMSENYNDMYNNGLITMVGHWNHADTYFGSYSVLGNSNYLRNDYVGSAQGYGALMGESNTAYGGGFQTILGYRNEVMGPKYVMGYANTAKNIGYGVILGYNNYDSQSGDYPFSNVDSNDLGHAIMLGCDNRNYNFTAYKNEHNYMQTMSLIVGSNNTAYGSNLYALGAHNIVGSTVTAIANDSYNDGFALAFGFANTAVRNYDMAIGLSSFASGGENLAIGTKENFEDWQITSIFTEYDEEGYKLPKNYSTSAIGYKNLVFHGIVNSGVSNYARNHAIISANNFNGQSISFNEATNFAFILGNGSNTYNNVFNESVLDTRNGSSYHNIVGNRSLLKSQDNKIQAKNIVINDGIICSNRDCFDNIVINSLLSGNNESVYNLGNSNLNGNILYGTLAYNTNYVVSFSDGSIPGQEDSSVIKNSFKLTNFGDNKIVSSYLSKIFGEKNKIENGFHSTIFGTDNSAKSIMFTNIFGEQNYAEMIGNSILYGKNNSISSTYSDSFNSNLFNYLIGEENKISGISNLYFNALIGNLNIISGDSNNSNLKTVGNFIYGEKNIEYIDSDNGFGYNFIFGKSNYNKNDLNFNFGAGNSGMNHLAMTMGQQLIANEHQIVFGKYNTELAGVSRFSNKFEQTGSYSWETELVPVDTTSGVLFVIGNGYFTMDEGDQYGENWVDEDKITRSNAMIVSANGTVSAQSDVIANNISLTSLNYQLTELLQLLARKPVDNRKYLIGCVSGELDWVEVSEYERQPEIVTEENSDANIDDEQVQQNILDEEI